MADTIENAQAKEKIFPNMPGIPDFGALFEANQQFFARWLEGTMALTKDISEFAQNRMTEDMAAWTALAGCKNLEEVTECQRRFAEKASAQYSEEISKLSKQMMSLATDGFHSLASAATKTA